MSVRLVRWCVGLAAAAALSAALAGAAQAAVRVTAAKAKPTAPAAHWCGLNGVTCAEPFQNWEDFHAFDTLRAHGVHMNEYIGHDEPSLLFYSGRRGSGNDVTYTITLPKDPPVRPRQDGSGGTWNFEDRITFWLGMAMCDDQSAPNPHYAGAPYPTVPCKADSDANVFTSTNAANPRYIGKAPGGAYMEMQFYPPGWVTWPDGISCDATRWCAALNIDSFSQNQNTGVFNNTACLNSASAEPVNFAFLTKNGVATTPANPLNGARFNLSPSRDYFMASGDRLRVHLFDTRAGFTVVIRDLTRHTTGSMVASAANGFASVRYAPNATSCTLVRHGFHPEFSTSRPATRQMWAAHSYNVAFSDEIGHFELCNKVDLKSSILACASGEGFDTNNIDVQDDNYCLPIPGVPSSLIQVTGCLGIFGDSDIDFDGTSYDARAWPGSIADPVAQRRLVPTPVSFNATTRGSRYSQVAFEADLPRIEDFRPDNPFGGVPNSCERFIQNPSDPHPGMFCVKPPPQSRDYPFYATAANGKSCVWKEVGGMHLAGLRSGFGGIAQYGPLLDSPYPTDPAGTVTRRFNNFHRTLGENPCPS